MSRSSIMAQLLRVAKIASESEKTGASSQEIIEQEGLKSASRRRFNQGAIAASALTTAGAVAAPFAKSGVEKLGQIVNEWRVTSTNVAVVGAGLAGLACATELARKGISTRVFEASGRVGGRCMSLRGHFPGQVVERGAEFINSSHHAMIGYARELGLTLEDYGVLPGTTYYQYGGSRYTEGCRRISCIRSVNS
jgi:monoamine oxidase